MPNYAARVNMPAPVVAKTGDGAEISVGFRMKEIMFDAVKARNMRHAHTRVETEAVRYYNWLWAGKEMDADIPAPKLLAVCRVDETGVPVLSNFPLPATAQTRVKVHNGKVGAARKALARASTILALPHKPVNIPAKPVLDLPDPFTEELITSIAIPQTIGEKK